MLIPDELMIESIISSAHKQMGGKELEVDHALHGVCDKNNGILVHNFTLVHGSNGHGQHSLGVHSGIQVHQSRTNIIVLLGDVINRLSVIR